MLEKIFMLAKIHFKELAYYKANYFLWTLNRLVEVVVYIFIWQAIYAQTGEAGGMTIKEMVTYYILVFSMVPVVTWGINENMAHSIRNGQIHKELLTPLSYFQYYFGIDLGELGYASIISISVFIICALIWGVTLPASLGHLLLFFLLIILGIPITYFIQILVGMVGFYTNSIWGMQILRKAVIAIFGGSIAPLVLFPEWFQMIANFLPFKELIYTPIKIYMGQMPIIEVLPIILKQALWAVALYIIAKIFFKHAVKKITVNGG